MPAEQKQLIHTSEIAAHKTLSAPESPLSQTERERDRERARERLREKKKRETYFCVRFESRKGRLKALQSF